MMLAEWIYYAGAVSAAYGYFEALCCLFDEPTGLPSVAQIADKAQAAELMAVPALSGSRESCNFCGSFTHSTEEWRSCKGRRRPTEMIGPLHALDPPPSRHNIGEWVAIGCQALKRQASKQAPTAAPSHGKPVKR